MKLTKTREPLTHRLWAKIAALLLTPLLATITILSVMTASVMIEERIYSIPKNDYEIMEQERLAENFAQDVYYHLMDDMKTHRKGQKRAEAYLEDTNIIGARVTEEKKVIWEYGIAHESAHITGYSFPLDFAEGQNLDPHGEIRVYIDTSLPKYDNFYWQHILIETIYALRYGIYAIGICALILSIWGFVFLMRAAGHRRGKTEIVPYWGVKIPVEPFLCAMVLGFFLLYQCIIEGYIYGSVSYLFVGLPILFFVFLLLAMDFSVRIKEGHMFRHSATYFLGRLIKMTGAFLVSLGKGLPLVWKTAVIYWGISLLELLLLKYNWAELDNLLIIWAVTNVLLFPAVLFAALMMRKLQKAGKALASGDFDYQTDTSQMVLDFKSHGENLNHIAQGMSMAVEQRLKSERMKTELITNVSHDIKTPLTSIINYSDLICKETCDNPKIGEYSQVLNRQSERLKRLIEDLVEASKASTGNLEVVLAPCEVGVMLTQIAGEYEERLKKADLELVTKQPKTPVKILADGRRLCRVFDNLMTNICKYSQSGTRVYLTLEEKEGSAVISFKNTSHAPLDLSPEELLERFVRGDSSRKSEGNGLGLSIAKSLTELQGGSLDLMVDGDFFKVILTFPVKDI